MDVLRESLAAPRTPLLAAANDDCARVPVMRPRRSYRRVALHNEATRRTAAALGVALAFCAWWLGLRAVSGAEIEAVRQRLSIEGGAAAVQRFDVELAGHEAPSLLRLHRLRAQATIAASAGSSAG